MKCGKEYTSTSGYLPERAFNLLHPTIRILCGEENNTFQKNYNYRLSLVDSAEELLVIAHFNLHSFRGE